MNFISARSIKNIYIFRRFNYSRLDINTGTKTNLKLFLMLTLFWTVLNGSDKSEFKKDLSCLKLLMSIYPQFNFSIQIRYKNTVEWFQLNIAYHTRSHESSIYFYQSNSYIKKHAGKMVKKNKILRV